MIDTATLATKILNEPEEAVIHLQLCYASGALLSISRIKEKNQFSYVTENNKAIGAADLSRIKKLIIPPAWQDVKIAAVANAHLQAIGYDIKNRKQYKYHTIWTKIRNRTKFFKMVSFGKSLPKIRTRVDSDLALVGWPKNKVLALIIKLMEETHIRVGNLQYARKNKTYGLSTLRSKHVTILKDSLRFEFVGKKGKEHKITLKNKELVNFVSKCEEIPGWELFKFYNADGEKTTVDSSMVNSYIQEIGGYPFTAKDFRTWAGTLIFFETLLDCKTPTNTTEIKQQLNIGFDATSKALGNTRNVCKKYYIHPLIIKKYEDQTLEPYFTKVKNTVNAQNQTSAEIVLLQIIEKYDPLKNL